MPVFVNVGLINMLCRHSYVVAEGYFDVLALWAAALSMVTGLLLLAMALNNAFFQGFTAWIAIAAVLAGPIFLIVEHVAMRGS